MAVNKADFGEESDMPRLLRMRRGGGIGKAGFGGRGFGRGWLGLAVPLVGTIIHDLRNPQGVLRPFVRNLLAKRTDKEIKEIIDAEYKIIEDKREEK